TPGNKTELIQLHSLSSMQSHSCRCVEPAVETTFWYLKSFLATKPQGDRSLSNCQFIRPSFGNKNPLGYVSCPFMKGKCKWDTCDPSVQGRHLMCTAMARCSHHRTKPQLV
uniref:Uncharacterized protein n=1 Tax=Meleagris gallopavo TaxID=9103 RepID=A0A803YAF3_MELGA